MKRLIPLILILLLQSSALAQSWSVWYMPPEDTVSRLFVVSDENGVIAGPDEYAEIVTLIVDSLYAVSRQITTTSAETREAALTPFMHPWLDEDNDLQYSAELPMALMDANGKLLTDFKYHFPRNAYDEETGLLTYYTDNYTRTGLMRIDGAVVSETDAKSYTEISDGQGGFLRCGKGKLVHVDADGRETDKGLPVYFVHSVCPEEDFFAIAACMIENDQCYWMLLDPLGNPVSGERFENIDRFDNGFAWVEIDSNYNYIDMNGQLILPRSCTVRRLEDSARFLGTQMKGDDMEVILYDADTGESLVMSSFHAPGATAVSDWWGGHLYSFYAVDDAHNHVAGCLYDAQTGQLTILPEGFRYSKTLEFDDGERRLRLEDENNLAYLADMDGNILSPGYYSFSITENSLIQTKRKIYTDEDFIYSYGFMDRDGAVLLEPVYSDISRVAPQRFAVRREGGSGVMDAQGNWVLEPVYQDIEVVSQDSDLIILAVDESHVGLAHSDGQWVLEPAYTSVQPFWPYEDAYLMSTDGTHVGLARSSGQWVLKPEYTRIESFDSGEGLILLEKDGTHVGLLRSSGEWLLEPEYTRIKKYAHDESLLILGVDEAHVGLASISDGEWVVEPTRAFDDIEALSPDIYKVYIKGRFGIMNSDGEWILAPLLRDPPPYLDQTLTMVLAPDRIWVASSTLAGIIDFKGNWLLSLDKEFLQD